METSKSTQSASRETCLGIPFVEERMISEEERAILQREARQSLGRIRMDDQRRTCAVAAARVKWNSGKSTFTYSHGNTRIITISDPRNLPWISLF